MCVWTRWIKPARNRTSRIPRDQLQPGYQQSQFMLTAGTFIKTWAKHEDSFFCNANPRYLLSKNYSKRGTKKLAPCYHSPTRRLISRRVPCWSQSCFEACDDVKSIQIHPVEWSVSSRSFWKRSTVPISVNPLITLAHCYFVIYWNFPWWSQRISMVCIFCSCMLSPPMDVLKPCLHLRTSWRQLNRHFPVGLTSKVRSWRAICEIFHSAGVLRVSVVEKQWSKMRRAWDDKYHQLQQFAISQPRP